MSAFVLASGSPRRRQLLLGLGGDFDVVAPDIDEAVKINETAPAYVARISTEKAAVVAERVNDDRPVLAADTCVVLDERILGKPVDAEDAIVTLGLLSGRTHWTTTGITVSSPDRTDTVTVRTDVTFAALSPAQIEWYVATGEPLDKAGSYAIQGAAGAFVSRIEGSHSNVVGLPLAETVALLAQHGVSLAGVPT